MKDRFTLGQTLTVAFLAIGAIAVSAIVCNYAGNIELKFGADGIHFQVGGGDNFP